MTPIVCNNLIPFYYFFLINLWNPTIHFANKDQAIKNKYTLVLAFFRGLKDQT